MKNDNEAKAGEEEEYDYEIDEKKNRVLKIYKELCMQIVKIAELLKLWGF